MNKSWNTVWLGNTLGEWGYALLILAGACILGLLLLRVMHHRLVARAAQRESKVLDAAAQVIGATRPWLLCLFALLVVACFLTWPDGVRSRLVHGAELLFGVQVALWLSRLATITLSHAGAREDGRGPSALSGVLTWAVRVTIWVLLLIVVLANAGVNVTAFVASLGVGGIAVALAAQNVLADLFASLSIGLDKPFDVGDDIAFGNERGTVARVGIKSTRVQSLSGEELVISNTQLLQQLVRNYGRMRERRVAFGFGLPLDTSAAATQRMVDDVKALIRSLAVVRFGRGHMIGFGESSLNLEFVYFVLDPDVEVYRDVQQQINLGILELLREHGLRLAMPARVLHRPA